MQKRNIVLLVVLVIALAAVLRLVPLTTASSRPAAPTLIPTATNGNNPNIWQGSFFQPRLVSSWTAANWDAEYQIMLDVRMDHVIWQWTVDSSPAEMCAYYPTSLPGFTQCNATDSVLLSLQRAQVKGIKVWLGLNWTTAWFTRGATDPAWLTDEFNLSKQVAQELWDRYGAQYGSSIAGFYLTLEMDNVNFSTATLENRMIAVYNDAAATIHTTTNKPVMVAPFFNSAEGQTPQQYADMWGRIVAGAPLDVVALQDGVGVGHATVATVAEWFAPMSAAIHAARPETEFWSDLETMEGNIQADMDRVIGQLEAEKLYVDKFTTFSFNHYDSLQQGSLIQYNQWKAYVEGVGSRK